MVLLFADSTKCSTPWESFADLLVFCQKYRFVTYGTKEG